MHVLDVTLKQLVPKRITGDSQGPLSFQVVDVFRQEFTWERLDIIWQAVPGGRSRRWGAHLSQPGRYQRCSCDLRWYGVEKWRVDSCAAR